MRKPGQTIKSRTAASDKKIQDLQDLFKNKTDAICQAFNEAYLEIYKEPVPYKQIPYHRPFAYVGGKLKSIPFLIEQLPKTRGLVDVFGGSGGVSINLAPYYNTTFYNDLSGDLCNFFQVLRDQTFPLLRSLIFTPYSREEYYRCAAAHKRGYCDQQGNELSNLEKARMLFVQISQGISHQYKSSPNGFSVDIHGDHNHLSGNTMYLHELFSVAERFKMIYIENRDVLQLIDDYDNDRGGTETNLFYLDPPYLGSKQAYKLDFTPDNYKKMVDRLNTISGPAAISGYITPEMESLIRGWECVVERELKPSLAKAGIRATQALWRNKRCTELWQQQNAQMSLWSTYET
jgi:DNA adenine methylase